MFKEDLDKVIGKHPNIDSDWIVEAIKSIVSPGEWHIIMHTKSHGELQAIGIAVGVRESVDGHSDIVTIYRQNEAVLSQNFSRELDDVL